MDDATRAVVEAIDEQGWIFPGRLSSHLASRTGPYHNQPFAWREVIEQAERDGLIKIGEPDERMIVLSMEDAEARADAMARVDSHQPMALEPQNPNPPPVPENPESQNRLSPPAAENPEPFAPGPAGYCRECECDLHACPGCGEPLKHDSLSCASCALDINPTALAEVNYAPRWEEQEFPAKAAEAVTAPARRKRRTPEEAEADKAAKVLEREAAREERRLKSEQAKLERAQERVRAKEQARLDKIAEAEGGYVELPALVLRDGTVRHVSDVDAWAVMELYLGHLMADCENSGYPLGHQLYELRTIQLGGEEAAVVFDAADPAQTAIVALAVALAKKISAHSAAADAIPLVVAGLVTWDDIWAKMHDSVLYLKLIDPKLSGSDASKLKEVARDLLFEYAVSPQAEKDKNALFKAMGCLTETNITTPPERSGWHSVNKNSVVMCRYAGSDVLDLAAVMRVLPPLPVADSVLDRERWFEAKCARVGMDGFKLNSAHIKEKIAEHEKAKAQAQRDVAILSENRIQNPSSPDAAKAILAQFPGVSLGVSEKTGDPSAAKKELERVCRAARGADELLYYLCKQILAYRHHVTTLGLLLYALERRCDYGDARMRPTVYTINADTGRTSCVRENGQQFSRRGGIRACVVADDALELELVNGKWEVVR